jgi:hypothetical protein
MKTQEEILKRINDPKYQDLFGTQTSDLVSFLTFDNAKQFLKEEFVTEVEKGNKTWEQKTDAKKEILGYLPFAYEKAEGQRGLSAVRSLLHMKSWIWLDGGHGYENDGFSDEICDMMEESNDYGIEVLDKISKHYGYEKIEA